MVKEVKDYTASIRQKLFNLAKSTNRPFQELLQYYAIERFLYRLSTLPYCHQLCLKGALMFTVWEAHDTRPTRDIDFLGKTSNCPDNIASLCKEICNIENQQDGIEFLSKTIVSNIVQEKSEYSGIRVKFKAQLANAQIPMQVDIGFSDEVYPAPTNISYPTFLKLPAPIIFGYPPPKVLLQKKLRLWFNEG